jgi:hypothetical protein
MANQEALMAEYSVLRQDITQTSQKNMQIIGAALAVVSIFIVYGFQAQSSLAFFAANIIFIGTIYIVADGRRHIISVATYLYAIVEPKVEGLQWETMAEEYRKREARFSLRRLYPVAIFANALFCIGSIFFAWLLLKDYHIFNILLYTCISLILGVSFILVSMYALQGEANKYRSDFVKYWKQTEEKLYPSILIEQE